MIPYTLLLSVVFFNLLLYKLTKKKLFIQFIFFVAILFSGLRVDVGVDYNSYVEGFSGIIKGYPSDFELGTQFLIKLIDGFGYGPQTFLFLCALITNIFIYLFIMQHSRNVVISVLVYFFITFYYVASFNAVRQYVAISIALFSLRYIINRNLFMYVFFVVFGSVFHISSVLTLPLYFFLTRKYNTLTLIIGGFFLLLFLYLSITFLSSYLFHTSYMNFINKTSSRGLIFLFMFINIFLIFQIKNISIETLLFKNMLFISLLLLILVLIFPVFSMGLIRLNSFYLFSLIPLMSYLPNYGRIRVEVTLTKFFILFVCLTYYYHILLNKGDIYNLVPYTFYFEVF